LLCEGTSEYKQRAVLAGTWTAELGESASCQKLGAERLPDEQVADKGNEFLPPQSSNCHKATLLGETVPTQSPLLILLPLLQNVDDPPVPPLGKSTLLRHDSAKELT